MDDHGEMMSQDGAIPDDPDCLSYEECMRLLANPREASTTDLSLEVARLRAENNRLKAWSIAAAETVRTINQGVSEMNAIGDAATAHETQSTIHAWATETFPGGEAMDPRFAERFFEEAVELCLEAGVEPGRLADILSHETAKKSGEEFASIGLWDSGFANPARVPAEAADVLITLYVLAGKRGFDLHAEVDRKHKINVARRWHAKGDGTGYHIREDA